ncbi:maltose/maltodextrin ABC transporter substrate-binding protein MalE [Pseudomonas sp. LPB0260]|uniref:maltose/maltodextrin ABC transporter substrate-binding protein MalE n=1 Tax=Pseudomonas sp. LPB0260 TaxID=2614442 RepID=UPI0015C26ECA|nr:maltose/maltodextrin ABC transporter substrate-binding protein MalE [Pseudomonas sp. LPB0260]QLC72098.1 maltose/maltodextrin ABC transporter substrate-binding protein MalE [Pseudomonas sp. LPB0260]QLC74876.1 maltose/maltodextrin ABC transporter substrate-binding protein MalE [Pseudomonas sp. LPB0260]
MNKKLFGAAAIGLAATLGLPLTSQAAIEEGKLVIWINGDKGYKGLAEVGERFTADTGIKVEVAHPDSATDKFQQAAATGNGPDIFIWAHDRFGEWAQSGLISPINPSAKTRAESEDFAWQAVTYDGKLWGYPIAVEATGLIYNKALVKTPPASFDEVMALNEELAKDGKRAILWDYNNTYFTWPLLAANGGYVFAEADGGFDVSKTGVNSAGAKQGAATLKALIDQGVMPKGADYSVAEAAFNKGESAMFISGPWAWSNIKKSGIDFGVAPIPAVGSEPSKPFSGVMAATLNAASPNQALAVEFLESYLLQVEGLRTVNADVPLGAVTHKAYMAELASDPLIKATFDNAAMGRPMPNVPEMGAFWSAMAPALTNITSGRQSVDAALDDAAKRIAK